MVAGNPPRAEAAQMATNDLLEQIPYASYGPITPYCGDPYCPYHHPRPWGSALPPTACSGCAGGKSLGHGAPVESEYYAPAVDGRGILPTPVPSALPASDTVLPRTSVDGNGNVPPVVVDEARRRSNTQQRAAMRRLPAVMGDPGTRMATRTRTGLPSQHARPYAPPPTSVGSASAPVNRIRQSIPSAGTQPPQPIEQTRQAGKEIWWKKLF